MIKYLEFQIINIDFGITKPKNSLEHIIIIKIQFGIECLPIISDKNVEIRYTTPV